MSDKTIQLPEGFQYSGLAAGIKDSNAPDLALVVSDENCVAAGVYTKNLVRAASIDRNKKLTPSDQIRAVVINSGNANACTGEQGAKDNEEIATKLADQLGTRSDQILVLSTGIIGQPLPMVRIAPAIERAVERLGANESDFELACRAIMTTDSGPKTARRSFETGNSSVKIAGMAKGAGMIGPKMATMLCVMVTDAPLSPEQAQVALKNAVDASFNRISVDGHTSTNDAAILMSNNSKRSKLVADSFEVFTEELTSLCIEMARMIPRDGEGARHLITIDISGAASHDQADTIARTVANSNLVKTAIAGGDPNWGRIVSAIGYCEKVELDPSDISLELNGFLLFRSGEPVPFDPAEVSHSLKQQAEAKIDIIVGGGKGHSRHWTSDLTVDYVTFNSEYST